MKEGPGLFAGLLGRNSLSCFDLIMSIMPAMIFTVISLLVSAAIIGLQLIEGHNILPIVISALLSSFVPAYSSLFIVGAITTITQWQHIHTSTARKILFTLTFPLFMFTYVPICIASVFGKVEWKPIEHKVTVSIQQMK